MSELSTCARCGTEEESCLHALRDCVRAKEVWNTLLPYGDAELFYEVSGRDWISWLMKSGATGGRPSRWTERMFGACWLQWRWRNFEVFEGVQLSLQHRLRQVVFWLEDDRAAFVGDEGHPMGSDWYMGRLG